MGLSRRQFTREFKLAARYGGWKQGYRWPRRRGRWKSTPTCCTVGGVSFGRGRAMPFPATGRRAGEIYGSWEMGEAFRKLSEKKPGGGCLGSDLSDDEWLAFQCGVAVAAISRVFASASLISQPKGGKGTRKGRSFHPGKGCRKGRRKGRNFETPNKERRSKPRSKSKAFRGRGHYHYPEPPPASQKDFDQRDLRLMGEAFRKLSEKKPGGGCLGSNLSDDECRAGALERGPDRRVGAEDRSAGGGDRFFEGVLAAHRATADAQTQNPFNVVAPLAA